MSNQAQCTFQRNAHFYEKVASPIKGFNKEVEIMKNQIESLELKTLKIKIKKCTREAQQYA